MRFYSLFDRLETLPWSLTYPESISLQTQGLLAEVSLNLVLDNSLYK